MAAVLLLSQALTATPAVAGSLVIPTSGTESATTVEAAAAPSSSAVNQSSVSHAVMVERAQYQISALLRNDESQDISSLMPAYSTLAIDASLSRGITDVLALTLDSLDLGPAINGWTADGLPIEITHVADARGVGVGVGGGGAGSGFAGAPSASYGIESRGSSSDLGADTSNGHESSGLSARASAFALQALVASGGDFNAHNRQDGGDRGDRRGGGYSDDSFRGDTRARDGHGRGGDERRYRDAPRQPPDANIPVSVPEPASLLLTSIGLFGLARAMRRRMGTSRVLKESDWQGY